MQLKFCLAIVLIVAEWNGMDLTVAAQKPPSDGSVRLAGSGSYEEGRVEIFYENQWGTICDDFWDPSDALVVCKQLGFSGVKAIYSNAYFGPGSGPILTSLLCLGQESSWIDCYYYEWDHANTCSHYDDASVRCIVSENDESGREGSVRLRGSPSVNAGRVEVYHYGEWGTVCDDGWSQSEANVVCKQLGYPDGANYAHQAAHYGEGDGPILLDDVSCSGGEHYLDDCNHGGWYDHDCAHSEDAGVECIIPDRYYPRLANGSTWYEGRVEIWNSNNWEALCSWNVNQDEARTVCKQLGFKDVDTVYYYEKFGSFDTFSPVYFSCDEYDTELSSCSQYPQDRVNCQATAIRCKYVGPLSGWAIAGIVLVVLVFFSIVVAACVTVQRQSKLTNRGQPVNVAVISGVAHPAGSQIESSNSGPPGRPHQNTIEGTPQSFRGMASNRVHFTSLTNANTTTPPQPHGSVTGRQANSTACQVYQPQPNPVHYNVSTNSAVHPLPSVVNQNINRPYPTQMQRHTLQNVSSPTQVETHQATPYNTFQNLPVNTRSHQNASVVAANSLTTSSALEATHKEPGSVNPGENFFQSNC